ncbi:M20/M25/M40 family metallo-hydrolase [Subsaximicrobium wynnwilliamsii]|uniref:Carboxypeptidase Q n=1 Tax=Subsaximicrobium wynnwilliamsii TaxID=291179 RepID=A0A5C6ZDT9_9FLAO|nr:M20/M25/M40 family metallo-hydrolase [Subsaximicrobium wynnwilliamsii]TXD82057.1 M20/M25/M40 family metallo-hydrolase [Subsaximicrobium wynnwilliamsii]TXD87259.1 M20/M25/M40 family metallo-hydrolase [Subsaximicrobium wynnwilliamsii]TXE01517.1 M20/M25/M40 family metallo-hydrolase [Subsaximicrobium wynnwilliamsii]
MKQLLYTALLLFGLTTFAQTDADNLKKIYTTSLTNGMSYEWLDHLSNQIGGRLSGSLNAERAVAYTKEELEKLGLDKVWLQPVMVPRWVRGAPEFAYIETSPGVTTNLNICALGGSVATPLGGVKASVVEVMGIEELAALGKDKISGNIVFFNRPMQADLIQTFEAYGGCVDQRYAGAMEAAKYGAVGVIVRSMNLRMDDFPHTGAMSYGDLPNNQRIPSAAISTNDAELLSGMMALNKNTKLFFSQNCTQLADVESYNVIGEVTGSEFPNEIIVVGGHLDSWDLGDGAHDDGAGVVQSMDVLRLLKESGITPKRSIRAVLFMNEENGLRGGKKYAEVAKTKNEKHIFALESDSGGFTPRGFSFDCSDAMMVKIESWIPLFKPYLIHYFEKGGSGADIGPLKDDNIVLAGLRPDSQRYFDYHHAANDTFEAVNKRELELGAASMAALVYLIDKYGTETISSETKLKN